MGKLAQRNIQAIKTTIITSIFPVSLNLNFAPPLLLGSVFESVDPEEEDPVGELEKGVLLLGESVVESGSSASLKIFASGEFGGRFKIAANETISNNNTQWSGSQSKKRMRRLSNPRVFGVYEGHIIRPPYNASYGLHCNGVPIR